MDIEKAKERCNQLIKAEHANWIGISNQIAIDTVLSELEKKNTEIIEAKEANRQLSLEVEKKDKYIDFYKKGLERESNRENVLEIIKQDNLLRKKDKIIDKMAKYIASLDTDEDICKNIQCTDGVNKLHKNCSECIKEYFIKKATDNVGE